MRQHPLIKKNIYSFPLFIMLDLVMYNEIIILQIQFEQGSVVD